MPCNFLWNTVCVSSEAAVSDCEVLNYKIWFAFAKIVYICLVSVMWYLMQDCIQVCVNIIQQHKCLPLVSKLHHFRREERNFIRYYKVCC